MPPHPHSPSFLMFIIQFRRANQSANGDSVVAGPQYYYRWEDHSSCARPSASAPWWRPPSSCWSPCPLWTSWPPSSTTPPSSPTRTQRTPSRSWRTVLNVSPLDYLWYGMMSDKWTCARYFLLFSAVFSSLRELFAISLFINYNSM